MFKNVSFYKFVDLKDTASLQRLLLENARRLNLKGTILIAQEGINAMLCGSPEGIDEFVEVFTRDPNFSGVHVKESFSLETSFERLIVKCKKEIITFRGTVLDPKKSTGKYLKPEDLDIWYAEKRPFVILDTRNDFEVVAGKFKNAINPVLKSFSDFVQYVRSHKKELSKTPVVTYCTGGIRCEKATAFMIEEGLSDVFQVEGGILNYFEKTDGKNFEGNCFVFDKRETLGSDLKPTRKTAII